MLACLSHDPKGANVIVANAPLQGEPVDISSLTTDWEIVVHILFLSPGKRALLHVHDTDNNFATSFPGPTFNPVGEPQSLTPITFAASARDYPSLRFGMAKAKLRMDLVALDPGANIRYSAFVRTPDN